MTNFCTTFKTEECITVACVPPTHWPYPIVSDVSQRGDVPPADADLLHPLQMQTPSLFNADPPGCRPICLGCRPPSPLCRPHPLIRPPPSRFRPCWEVNSSSQCMLEVQMAVSPNFLKWLWSKLLFRFQMAYLLNIYIISPSKFWVE